VSTAKGPKVRVQRASAKRGSTPAAAASLSAANWRRKCETKAARLLGPSVAPVVLFVSVKRWPDVRGWIVLAIAAVDGRQIICGVALPRAPRCSSLARQPPQLAVSFELSAAGSSLHVNLLAHPHDYRSAVSVSVCRSQLA